MDDLITWLRAQLDEDEQTATKIFRDHTWSVYLEGGDDGWAVEGAHSGEPSCTVGDEAMAAHIARHDPARELREVEAKRKIIELHGHEETRFEAIARATGTAPSATPWRTCRECGARDQDGTPLLGEKPGWCATLCLLALPYSDRPGYREEWKPSTDDLPDTPQCPPS